MAKKDKQNIEKKSEATEMSIAEARALRASKAKPAAPVLTDEQKREHFRLFWAQEKHKYGKSKDLESVLWLHLKAIKMDDPSKFDQGVAHFGLKKIR